MKYREHYRQELQDYFGGGISVHLFWKGRVAFYALLKGLDIGPGDEVIIPAFTCVVVPNAIIYTGARPVYVDVDPQTYNMSQEAVAAAISPKTKAIVAQNTFGLPPNLDSLKSIAQERQIALIEDCTHGFGGTYKGQLNGTIADASFFSTQWNKPYSTGIGGFAVVKNTRLGQKMAALEAAAQEPSAKDRLVLKALIETKSRLLNERTYWLAVNLYRFLSKNNLVLGSSQKEELQGPVMPPNFLKKAAPVQGKLGAKELERISHYNQHRQELANYYNKALKDLGVSPPVVPEGFEHIYLRYPLLVKDRAFLFDKARQEKVELGDWFISPIHPVQDNFDKWQYSYGSFPVAERLARHMINLPTHPDMTIPKAGKVISFLNRHRDQLMI